MLRLRGVRGKKFESCRRHIHRTEGDISDCVYNQRFYTFRAHLMRAKFEGASTVFSSGKHHHVYHLRCRRVLRLPTAAIFWRSARFWYVVQLSAVFWNDAVFPPSCWCGE